MTTDELIKELEDLSTRLKQWFGSKQPPNTHAVAIQLIDEAIEKLKISKQLLTSRTTCTILRT